MINDLKKEGDRMYRNLFWYSLRKEFEVKTINVTKDATVNELNNLLNEKEKMIASDDMNNKN
jgi:hypothetical protein